MKTLFVLALAFSCHLVSAQDEKIKKELEQLSWDWMNAWKAKDTLHLQKILAPDYRLLALINGELVAVNRERWLKTVPVYTPTSFRYYDFDTRIFGNTAIVQSKFDQEATLNGQDRSGTFQVTDVWVKNKSGWQVVHRHSTLKPKALPKKTESQEQKEITNTLVAIANAWTKNDIDTLEKYIDKSYLHTDVRGHVQNRKLGLVTFAIEKEKMWQILK